MLRNLILSLIICLLATPVNAQGIEVGWGDADGFGENLADPCDPPGKVHEIVGAFRMPPELSSVYSMEATLDFCTLPRELPPWWGGAGAESCNQAELSANADFSQGPFTALDYFGPEATTTMRLENPWLGNPVRARAVITVEIPPEHASPVGAGTKVYAFRFVIDGSNADCPGCDLQACFMTNGITLTGPEGSVRFYGPYFSSYVGWRYFRLGCPHVVSSVKKSLGTVKAEFD